MKPEGLQIDTEVAWFAFYHAAVEEISQRGLNGWRLVSLTQHKPDGLVNLIFQRDRAVYTQKQMADARSMI